MRGELGYERIGQSNRFKVWRQASSKNPDLYYLVGYVEKTGIRFSPKRWAAFTPGNVLVNFFVTRKEAALSIPMPGYVFCKHCGNEVHESDVCKGRLWDVLCPACKDMGL